MDLNCNRLARALTVGRLRKTMDYDAALAQEQVLTAREKRRRQRIQMLNSRRRARVASAPGSFTRAEWQALLEAHQHCCAYCHKHFQKLTVDHVIPLSKGGSNDISNIVPACRSCNSRKGARC